MKGNAHELLKYFLPDSLIATHEKNHMMDVPNFPTQLRFSTVSPKAFEDAQGAIQQEYNDANSWKRLHCCSVERVEENENERREIYVLNIDHSIEFAWTWEGARAFRPLRLDKIGRDETHIFDSALWSGKILNVDERNNQIFVEIYKGTPRPRKGTFLVSPFDFLEAIKNAYTESRYAPLQNLLKERLTATLTGSPDMLVDSNRLSMPRAPLYPDDSAPTVDWWNHAWGIIWGPPGTGKTYTTGQLVAEILKTSPEERILVVSTTNLATDAVALKIGEAVQERNLPHLSEGRLYRLGKGAQLSSFKRAGLVSMLYDDTEILDEQERLKDELAKCEDETQKAQLALEIGDLKRLMDDPVKHHFLNSKTSTVVCTAFKATRMVTDDDISEMIRNGFAPFTTVIIDEAGMLSRMNAAMLSLLASKRIILVGDSKQLSPISRISRVIETELSMWIASSGLVHLDEIPVDKRPSNVHFLKKQWRMHRDIANAVSSFMYEDALIHAESVFEREITSPFALYHGQKDLLSGENDAEPPRAVWYVLDEEIKGTNIRHDRGPGNKSYVRDGSFRILDRFFENETFFKANGLFLSPFVAQAKKVREYLAKKGCRSWKSSTVHCQQGQEADIVIFDTVNAGSTAWTHHEWMRMVNVGISRARRLLILLASRAEMSEPYLKPLCRSLQPSILAPPKERWEWKIVETIRSTVPYDPSAGVLPDWVQKIPPNSLGRQIAERQLLDPVFSQLQQQLCNRDIDGKPRLIRGVAGSGKTVILAEWLVRSLLKSPEKNAPVDRRPFWIVFGNNTLETLIKRHVDTAWEKYTGETSPPEGTVVYHHILRLLDALIKEYNLDGVVREKIKKNEIHGNFDLDGKSSVVLNALTTVNDPTRCKALFIDEAQDMGPNTLRLLFKLITPPADQKQESFAPADDSAKKTTEEKPVYIFYDNAQNVYGRGTPTWSHLGIDLKGGRATVMKESFRSTKEIAELAFNVLYRLQPDEMGDDHKELIRNGLIEKTERNNRPWWNVKFNQNSGPKPSVWEFDDRTHEFSILTDELIRLVTNEHVSPEHIRILCNNRQSFMKLMDQHVRHRLLKATNGRVDYIYKESGTICENTILVTSAHSFKGYESEIVFIPAADMFESNGDILAAPLYVAMTRARSILKMSFSTQTNEQFAAARKRFMSKDVIDRRYEAVSRLFVSLRECYEDFHTPPTVDTRETISANENLAMLLDTLTSDSFSRTDCEKWLTGIQEKYIINREPLLAPDGSILGEPLFFFKAKGGFRACFGSSGASPEEREQLRMHGIGVIEIGGSYE
ncbi:MAG TPA: AAA family ATPase [Planctomycetaceae bacterium]|nr:AAA family ATPase [Planctomycetaceae bacterium]